MSNDIQPDLSDHPCEHESQANSNPVPSNRPLRDLVENSEKYLRIGLPLYQASIKCDWKAAKAILDKNPDMNLLRQSITETGETALHIAASAIAPKKKVDEFVRNLVKRMTLEDLELVNNNESTALYLAVVAGNITTVKIMMEKNPTLDAIPGGKEGMMPLYRAVLYGYKHVARYLYKSSVSLLKEGWNPVNRGLLLEKCVESDMFDIAIRIAENHGELGKSIIILELLAKKPEAFYEMKYSNTEYIRGTIKSVSAMFGCTAGTPVERNDALLLLRIIWADILQMRNGDIDDILRGPRDSIKSGRIVQTIQLKQLFFYHLNKLVAEIQMLEQGTLSRENLEDIISKHVVSLHVETQSLIKQQNTTDEDQVLDLQKHISEYIEELHNETHRIKSFDYFNENIAKRFILEITSNHIEKLRYETEIRATYSSRVMFIAAEVGNTNFLLELIRRRPDLIWQVDDNRLTMFHIAVKHRHEGIYNLLYEIGSMKDMVTTIRDKDGNNMLHLTAMSTRKKNLENVSGPALQMQRELLWFEEVERMIPPSSRVSKNKDGFTPRELFTMEHQDLIDQGEKWLKETASQCMVVATLIATIVFAAAFTVPGGYGQNDGIPMFKRKLSFVAFVVADAISLFLSSASILTFLSILTSRYAERDFVAALPKKLMFGLVTLFLSIGTMMVTFSVSFFVLYHREMKWIPIFISLFAIIPAILYVLLQRHLLIDVFRSTNGGKYLFKPTRQVLFYENPKF